MADHKAEQIMDAIQALITGLVTTGTNVVRNKVFGWEGSDGLDLAMGDDVVLEGSDNNISTLDSDLTVFITAFTKNASTEQQLNLIKKEVTIAVKADYTLSGVATDVNELSWSSPTVEGDGDEYTGSTTGVFVVRYRRSRADPSLP